MKIKARLFPVLCMVLLGLIGCSSSDPFKNTAIKIETDKLKTMLRESLEPEKLISTGASPDTVFVAGYPEKSVDYEGTKYTIFSLGEPDYSPGSHGSTYSTFDARTGAMITHYTPPTNASISIDKGDIRFAAEEDFPILKRRTWIFFKKPHLYYFPAEISGSYLPHDGVGVRILKSASKPESADWSPLHPPQLPSHLSDLDGSVVFIAKRNYDLGSTGAPVPKNFQIEFDHKSTRKLYEKVVSGDFEGKFKWETDDLGRLLKWLDAYPLVWGAESLFLNYDTPWFIAADRPFLVREKRLHKAKSLLAEAASHDPGWDAPPELMGTVEDELEDLPKKKSESHPMGKKFRLGLGTRFLFYGQGYNFPYEDKDQSINFSLYGHYQLLQNFALTIGSEAAKIMVPSTDLPYKSSFAPGQLYLHVNYQVPIRFQFGNSGKRIQLTAGVVRLTEEIEDQKQKYKGRGWGFDVALSLVSRKDYYFRGPESSLMNKSGLIEIGYRAGAIDEYTTSIGGREVTLANVNGDNIQFKPSGFWIALNIDYFGF